MVPIAGWSSQVARQAHNLKVVGSNPTPATTSFQKCPLSQKSHADGKSRTLTVEFNDLESIGLPLIGFFEDSGVLAAGGPSRQVDDDDLAAE